MPDQARARDLLGSYVMEQLAQRGTRSRRYSEYAVLVCAIAALACGREQDATGPADGDTSSHAFRVYDKQSPKLDVLTDDPVYVSTCNMFQWETLIDDSWVPLRDERPTFAASGYFLNGSFVAPHVDHSGGHGACSCYQLIEGKYIPSPDEYVQVGSMAAPGADPGAAPAAVLEQRVVAGPIHARIRYFREPGCRTELHAIVPWD